MSTIASITSRRILNSHVEFTNEFIIRLKDGGVGVGSSPQGETVGAHERGSDAPGAQTIINQIAQDGCLGRDLSQEALDEYLSERVGRYGRNNAYALSLAFFRATGGWSARPEDGGSGQGRLRPPRLCCNILNGGRHAYTNPVLSDFPEYLLVARSRDLEEVISDHREIQREVRERLRALPKVDVAGHPVSRFRTADNRECIEFLLGIQERMGLAEKFDLMIDAAAGGLWEGNGYRLGVTDHSLRSTEAWEAYWLDLIRQYGVRFLEDPFREVDEGSWRRLTAGQTACQVIGDDFYCSAAARIEAGAANRCTHGVVVKPNQAGTITAVRRAVAVAQATGQVMIASHRSISTEETFLAELACFCGLELIKIGPLLTDYSSVIRLNAIVRLSE